MYKFGHSNLNLKHGLELLHRNGLASVLVVSLHYCIDFLICDLTPEFGERFLNIFFCDLASPVHVESVEQSSDLVFGQVLRQVHAGRQKLGIVDFVTLVNVDLVNDLF